MEEITSEMASWMIKEEDTVMLSVKPRSKESRSIFLSMESLNKSSGRTGKYTWNLFVPRGSYLTKLKVILKNFKNIWKILKRNKIETTLL